MKKLTDIEERHNITLPKIYKQFYRKCEDFVPSNLVGTDILNNESFECLRSEAEELLNDDGIACFLEPDDFVFMMHQGYMFWYFKANGEPDPTVFGYLEGKGKPDKLDQLSTFLDEF